MLNGAIVQRSGLLEYGPPERTGASKNVTPQASLSVTTCGTHRSRGVIIPLNVDRKACT
jgi:hypothetical protein